jgi:hypothetical protein
MSSSSHRSGRRSRRRPIAGPRARRSSARRAQPRPDPARVDVERRASVAVLHVSGEFDLCAVDRVEAALARATGDRTDRVVFNLRGVSFLDVCGLRTLLRADRWLHLVADAGEA